MASGRTGEPDQLSQTPLARWDWSVQVGASDRTISVVFESFVEIFAELQSVPQLSLCL